MFHTDAEKSSIALAPVKPSLLTERALTSLVLKVFSLKQASETGQLGGKSTRLDIFKIN